jgi:hypothetical protein
MPKSMKVYKVKVTYFRISEDLLSECKRQFEEKTIFLLRF